MALCEEKFAFLIPVEENIHTHIRHTILLRTYCPALYSLQWHELVLHVLLCITLIVATPIAQFGMTIKTILTLLFKVNNVFFMIKLKSAKNISGKKLKSLKRDINLDG